MTYEPSQDQNERPEKPKVFLYLAAVMVLLAVAAYIFQGPLLDLGDGPSTFVLALILPVVMALFFLYCYRMPRFGAKILGHSAAPVDKPHKAPGLSYNIFKGESAGEEKLAQTRRKSARHLRKKLARATAKPGDEDDNPS